MSVDAQKDREPLQRRMLPTLAVISTLLLTCAGLLASMYEVTSRYDRTGAFLKNDRPPTAFEVTPAIAMEYAVWSNEANDVVFFGGSTCMESVQSIRFGKLTGLKAYNLGTMGVLGVRGFALTAQVYLLHHPAPRVMVMCVYPTELILPPSHWGPAEDDVRDRFFSCYGNGVINRSFIDTIRQGLLIIYGNLNGGLKAALSTPMEESGTSYNDQAREINAGRGYADFVDTPHPNRSPDLEPILTGISDQARQGIEVIAQLAQSKGFQFIVRLTPSVMGDQPDMEGQKLQWISDLEAKYPNLTFSRPLTVPYDWSRMGDRFHCNPKGARAFTDLVVGEVQRVLANHKE